MFLCTTPTITLCVCHTIACLHTTMSHPHVFSLLRSCITSCPTHYYMSCYHAPPIFSYPPPKSVFHSLYLLLPSHAMVFPTLLFPSHGCTHYTVSLKKLKVSTAATTGQEDGSKMLCFIVSSLYVCACIMCA